MNYALTFDLISLIGAYLLVGINGKQYYVSKGVCI